MFIYALFMCISSTQYSNGERCSFMQDRPYPISYPNKRFANIGEWHDYMNSPITSAEDCEYLRRHIVRNVIENSHGHPPSNVRYICKRKQI